MNLITSTDDGMSRVAGDLTNQVLVISHIKLNRRYQIPRFQLFKATGGFGCKEGSLGSAVFGYHLADSEQARWDRSDFIGIADKDLVTRAMADTTPVQAININDRVFMVIAKDGSQAKGETPTEAMTRLRRITRSALLAAYSAHPESTINELGYMSYPSGAAPTEVKIKKQGVNWIDVK
jgi:hypothetical protein